MIVDGTPEAEDIIMRRLTKCINSQEHVMYEDLPFNSGSLTFQARRPINCPRCGIMSGFVYSLTEQRVISLHDIR